MFGMKVIRLTVVFTGTDQGTATHPDLFVKNGQLNNRTLFNNAIRKDDRIPHRSPCSDHHAR